MDSIGASGRQSPEPIILRAPTKLVTRATVNSQLTIVAQSPETCSHPSENQTLSNAQANSVYWDSIVDAFYEPLIGLPSAKELYKQVAQTLLSRYKFDPETTVLMDFACGNGALSVALAPHCRSIIGVDVSQGMVNAYNKRMRDLGIAKAQALHAELCPDEPQLSGHTFDAILCSQSYKHIDDNVAITRMLRNFLKPNGVLLVVDVLHGKSAVVHVMTDASSLMMNAMTSIPRPSDLKSRTEGYSEDDMKVIFDEAGLVDFTFEEAFVKEKDGKSFGLFLAKGVNPI